MVILALFVNHAYVKEFSVRENTEAGDRTHPMLYLLWTEASPQNTHWLTGYDVSTDWLLSFKLVCDWFPGY